MFFFFSTLLFIVSSQSNVLFEQVRLKKNDGWEEEWPKTAALGCSENKPAGTQRLEDVPIWPYFVRGISNHSRTKIARIRFLTYFGYAMSGKYLASGNVEKFP